jgi:hypothetical protein
MILSTFFDSACALLMVSSQNALSKKNQVQAAWQTDDPIGALRIATQFFNRGPTHVGGRRRGRFACPQMRMPRNQAGVPSG